MQSLVKTRDSLLTVLVRQHFTDKYKPIFSMLNKISGVSESDDLPKKGGEIKDKQPKQKTSEQTGENERKSKPNSNTKDQKDNEASESKGKEKVVSDEEE